MHLSFTIVPFIEKRKREVRMKRCIEVVTLAVKHLFVNCLMPSHCSNSFRRVDRGIILDLMRAFEGCDGSVVGYLVDGEDSDHVFTLFTAVELFLDVGVVMD